VPGGIVTGRSDGEKEVGDTDAGVEGLVWGDRAGDVDVDDEEE
jgi:hypothetical protein